MEPLADRRQPDPAPAGPSPAELDRAVEVLRAGGLVAFPTETVYGLGADAEQPGAVARIYAVKGRPVGHPLIVHLGEPAALDDWARDVGPAGRALARACWPGPLTLVVRRQGRVPDAVTGGRDTVGLRVPDQPVARALLRAFGGGVAAPSANRFGRVSPTTADHVRADLGPDVDVILDGGPCSVGVESTIVDVTVHPPVVLRPGGVPVERLAELLGGEVATATGGPARAPGMLPAHYAPAARVELAADAADAAARLAAHRATGTRAGLLAPDVDAATWAHELYGWLRRADRDGLEVLVVVPPGAAGLGAAVRDRLRRAAAAGTVDAGGGLSDPAG